MPIFVNDKNLSTHVKLDHVDHTSINDLDKYINENHPNKDYIVYNNHLIFTNIQPKMELKKLIIFCRHGNSVIYVCN